MELAGIKPNVVTYNTRLQLFVNRGDEEGVNRVLREMELAEIKPDVVTYTTRFQLSVNRDDEEGVNHLLREMELAGIKPNVVTYTTRLQLFVNRGDEEGVNRVLREMELAEIKPNVVTYNTRLQLFVNRGDEEDVNRVLREMEWAEIKPSVVTYNTRLQLFVNRGDEEGVNRVLREMELAGIKPNVVTYTTRLQLFVNRGDEEGVNRVLREMESAGTKLTAYERDKNLQTTIMTFNMVMNLYLKKRDLKKALQVLEVMRQSNVHPDKFTYSSLIKLADLEGNSQQVMDFLHEITDRHIFLDKVVLNVIIEALVNVDRLNLAEDLLKKHMRVGDLFENNLFYVNRLSVNTAYIAIRVFIKFIWANNSDFFIIIPGMSHDNSVSRIDFLLKKLSVDFPELKINRSYNNHFRITVKKPALQQVKQLRTHSSRK